MQGRCKVPDFVVFVCSVDLQASPKADKPVIRHIGPWWEVKRCLPVKEMPEASVGSSAFSQSFRKNFHQLSTQASCAFDNYPNTVVYRSIFSAGNHFAALEWLQPGVDKFPGGDSKATWLEQQTSDLEAKLDALIAEPLSRLDELRERSKPELQKVLMKYDSDLTALGKVNCKWRAMYFEERIFDLSEEQSLKSQSFIFTPRFLSALRWAFYMPHLNLVFENSLFTPPDTVKKPTEGSMVRIYWSFSILIDY